MSPLGFHVANNKEATAAPNFYGYGERYFDRDEKDVYFGPNIVQGPL